MALQERAENRDGYPAGVVAGIGIMSGVIGGGIGLLCWSVLMFTTSIQETTSPAVQMATLLIALVLGVIPVHWILYFLHETERL